MIDKMSVMFFLILLYIALRLKSRLCLHLKQFFKRLVPVMICFLILAAVVTAVSLWGSSQPETSLSEDASGQDTVEQNGEVCVDVEGKEEGKEGGKKTVNQTEQNKNSAVSLTTGKSEEMRGIWIPYMALTLKGEEQTENGFRNKMEGILSDCVMAGANTVIVQVRPFGDAIYPSAYFPWSHILTGTQGQAPDFDPFGIVVSMAHQMGLSVHAWINPFRIATAETPSTLADHNPCYRLRNTEEDQYTFTCQDALYYNPAHPMVRKLILDGVREILTNYEIEGIQMDDYFYPEEGGNYDQQSYQSYLRSVPENGIALKPDQWRKTNINILVSGIWSVVHECSDTAIFGISPQCNFDNNEKIGADVVTWGTEYGYVDYLCPQLYVSREHPVFPFRELAQKWKDTVTCDRVSLCFGLGLYKAGTDADNGTWLSHRDEISQEILISRELGTQGYILYSCESLRSEEAADEVRHIVELLSDHGNG